MLSPEDLERFLREQVEVASRILSEPKAPSWWRRVLVQVRRLWADRILFFLWGETLSSSIVAIVLLVDALPIGGGGSVGMISVAQGSSLIFVVILIGLLSGPLEAGRRTGLGSSVVANDSRTWIGLGWVSALSLGLLALGWSRPDSREELASIAVTASGLGVTGLVTRHLLRLSNPEVHLQDRLARSLGRIREIVQEGSKATAEAFQVTGIENDFAQRMSRYPSGETQRKVASHVEMFTTIAAVAWRNGDWRLAAQAHSCAVVLAVTYLTLINALDSQDLLLMTLINETDDLHEVSGGANGRKLSRALVRGLATLGVRVAAKEGVVDRDGQNPGVFRIVYELGTIIERRLADQKSEDPAAALSSMGDIAVACVASGAVWSSIATNERALDWAVAATNTNVVHIGMTAWGQAIRVIIALARSPNLAHRPTPFKAALDDLRRAIGRVERMPKWSVPSAFGPVLRSTTDGVNPTLQLAFYEIWEVDSSLLDEVVEFGRGIVRESVRLLDTSEGTAHLYASEDVGEILYQWMCAAATRGDRVPVTDPIHAIVVQSISNTLDWLRSLIISEGKVREDNALDELFHMYISGWQTLLYLHRGTSRLPPPVEKELQAFLGDLPDSVMPELPDTLEDGLRLLAQWLERVGANEAAGLALEKAERVPPQTHGSFVHSSQGWGVGAGQYFTRRGGLIAAVVARVEEFFAADGEAPSLDGP